MAANSLMLAELEGREEGSVAIVGLKLFFVHRLDVLANISRYLVVVLKPTVKWLCISGRARTSVSGRLISEEAAICSFKFPSIFLCLFFARFPFEGATFRECSPMGLSKLQERYHQLGTLRD